MSRRLALSVAIMLLWPAALWAAEGYTAPVISVPQVAAAPVVDGQVQPAEWSHAALLPPLAVVGSGGLAPLATEAFVQYDATNLYLGVICHDPQPARILKTVTERDGPVGQEDAVELFIDTVGDRQHTAHLAVNAAGTRFDAWDQDASQDFRWTAAAALREDGWSLEIALPFAGGVGPALGDTWLINLGRNAPAAGERSSWAPVERDFGELARLGTLVFAGSTVRVRLGTLGSLWLGRNLAQVELSPLGSLATPLAVKLNVRAAAPGPSDAFFRSQKVQIGTQPQTVSVAWTMPADGKNTVLMSLTDAKGQALWRSPTYTVEMPVVAPILREAEAALSQAVVAWSRLPEGEEKAATRAQLEETLTAWNTLVGKLRQRQSMTREQYAALQVEAQVLRAAALALAAPAAS